MGREAEVNGNQHTTAHLNGSSFTKWLSSRTYVPSLGVFGLDNAGKSCLLSWILQEEHVDLIQKSQRKFKSPNAEWIYPTVGFETHRFLRNGKEWQAVDLAGEGRYRSFWQVFAEKVDAIIFVIDITDESRFTSCQREFTALRQVLRQQQQQLQGQGQTVKPILIYLNKIDLLTAVESQNASIDTKNIRSNSKSVQFISRQQKLKQLLRLNMAEEKVHWKIQPCSTHTGEGILDGFRWLTSQVLHY